jgi:hypothetical protein
MRSGSAPAAMASKTRKARATRGFLISGRPYLNRGDLIDPNNVQTSCRKQKALEIDSLGPVDMSPWIRGFCGRLRSIGHKMGCVTDRDSVVNE